MKKEFINLVLKSKVLNPRKKWAIIRYIKKYAISENNLKKMMSAFEKEKDFLGLVKKNSDEQYLKALQEYNAKLEEIIHKEIPKKILENELKSKEEDEDEERRLLEELDNLC